MTTRKHVSAKRLCFLTLALLILQAAGVFAGEETSSDPANDPEGVFNLDEIVITGTKTPHLLKDVPVQTVVITQEEIKNSSAQTVSDLLKTVPGLFVVSEDIPGVTSWRSKLRGLDFNSGYGLILVNGQRVKGGGMGEYGYGLNQVPLSAIERIEVIKGPGSVLYGSDAMLGVINIITKPCPEEAKMGVELAGGSQGTKIGSAYAGTSMGNLGLFLNASISEADIGAYGYRSSRDETYDDKRFDSRISYRFSDKVKGDLVLAVDDQDRTRNYKTEDVQRHNWDKKYRVAPTVDITIDEASSAVITGYYYNWEMNAMESGSDSSGFTPTVGDMFYHDVEARYIRSFGERFCMTLGSEFLEEKLDYNMADESVGTLSGYAQMEAGFFENLTLVLGVRYDDHEKYGEYFSPKLSFMYRPFDDTAIRGSVGRGFKSPTIRQLYYTELYQHGTYWYRSNPNLEAETSWGYSLGVEQGLGRRLLFDLTLYRNDINDKVLSVDTGEFEDGLPITTYENVSKAHTQGVELSLKAILARGLTGTFSYTFTDTEDEDTGNELTYVPTNNLSAGLTWKYAPLDLTLSGTLQYADKMYTNADNSEETEAYTVVDLKAVKALGKGFTFSIEGNNVFDSDYGQPDSDWVGPTVLVRLTMDL